MLEKICEALHFQKFQRMQTVEDKVLLNSQGEIKKVKKQHHKVDYFRNGVLVNSYSTTEMNHKEQLYYDQFNNAIGELKFTYQKSVSFFTPEIKYIPLDRESSVEGCKWYTRRVTNYITTYGVSNETHKKVVQTSIGVLAATALALIGVLVLQSKNTI